VYGLRAAVFNPTGSFDPAMLANAYDARGIIESAIPQRTNADDQICISGAGIGEN
jgi:hypothetical protein